VSAAAWIRERLHPQFQDTGSVVPDGFAAYARVFHPVRSRSGQIERWAEVARRNGRIVHPEMQLHLIDRPVGSLPIVHGTEPDGYDTRLPYDVCQVLVELLRAATATPQRCWFCVWEGYSDVDTRGSGERVQHPLDRNYLLASGPIEDAVPTSQSAWGQAPNLWWPDDRSWIVVSEIDFAWTYVGGPAELVERLVGDRRLEALPALLTDKPFFDSDVINQAQEPDTPGPG
jgi:hypothetical protein